MEKYLELKKEYTDIKEEALELLIDRLYEFGVEGVEVKAPLNKEEIDTIDGDYLELKLLQQDKTTVILYIKEEEYIKNLENIRRLIAPFDMAEVEDEEKWLLAYQKYFKVYKPGKLFVIVPEWEKYTPKPEELIIKINPGAAFGTGTHPTTKNVLVLMEEIDFRDKEIADIGTGSGILTIGSILLGAKEVTVVDNDAKAIEVARENMKEYLNISYQANDLLKGINKKFDIVLANIVADVLLDLAKSIKANLKEKGKIIVSGIIADRWLEVDRAYIDQGFSLWKMIEEEGWHTALYERNK
ncbi:MAG: 50S ribosomal protein L11 methyltransferase [Fusobacteria bacterium]|nr:50S ribosomal protein L11 methyltransferase [Fusobacteriota bacterium]